MNNLLMETNEKTEFIRKILSRNIFKNQKEIQELFEKYKK